MTVFDEVYPLSIRLLGFSATPQERFTRRDIRAKDLSRFLLSRRLDSEEQWENLPLVFERSVHLDDLDESGIVIDLKSSNAAPAAQQVTRRDATGATLPVSARESCAC
jgi:hypothetical protein